MVLLAPFGSISTRVRKGRLPAAVAPITCSPGSIGIGVPH
jgi:hypothetical protein